jgi:hypothetical protein
MQVAHQPPDDGELLEILLAEDRDIGRALRQQLRDHGRDAGEEMRACDALQSFGRPAHRDGRAGAVRVHFGRLGSEDEVDAAGFEGGEVAGEVARIGGQIFRRSELRRVDEDRHHHPVGPPGSLIDQRQMTGVERPHGRDQSDALPGAPPCRDASAQLSDGRNELGTGHRQDSALLRRHSRERVSSTWRRTPCAVCDGGRPKAHQFSEPQRPVRRGDA